MKIVSACKAFLSLSFSFDVVFGDTPLNQLQFSVYNDGVVIRRFVGVSVKDCVKECGLRSSCVGLNYQRRMTLCELLSSEERPTITKSWVYLHMNDEIRQRIMAKHCGSRPNCAAGQKCAVLQNVPVQEFTCKIEECGEITGPINQMFPAETNMMHNISAKVKIKHAPLEPLYELQCCQDGTWKTVCGGTTTNPSTPQTTTIVSATTTQPPPSTKTQPPTTTTTTEPPPPTKTRPPTTTTTEPPPPTKTRPPTKTTTTESPPPTKTRPPTTTQPPTNTQPPTTTTTEPPPPTKTRPPTTSTTTEPPPPTKTRPPTTTTTTQPPPPTKTQPPTTTSDVTDLTTAIPLDWVSMDGKEIAIWKLGHVDWETAMRKCEQNGGTLAKFNNADEMKYLPALDDTLDGMWLAGKADTNTRAWTWVEKDLASDEYIVTQPIDEGFWSGRGLAVPDVDKSMCIYTHTWAVSPGVPDEYYLETAPCQEAKHFMCERVIMSLTAF